MKPLIVLNVHAPDGAHRARWVLTPGQLTTATIGHENIRLSGDVTWAPTRSPGDRLTDARAVAGVVIPHVWDESWMPTTRTLQDILADVVAHGRDFPSHGTDCVCMDKFSREIRLQVSKAVPPDTGAREDIHSRLNGRFRIAHVLRMVERAVR